MSAVITVNNLGKCYKVDHLNARRGYRTLRESLSNGVSSALNRLRRNGNATTREDFWALKDIDFEVQAGEVVGIIGRNGAGKSTLLKILSRITKPTMGEVELRGRVGSLLEVGTGFHPELTGRENIFLNGAILGMPRTQIASKFDEIVDFAGVDRFLDTPVKRYSSGMYVRLAFSVAAHLELEVMVIDEVLAVGDASFQKKCLGRMREMAESGRTVLFVSHNLSAIKQLCTQSLILDRGSVVFQGEVGEAIVRYQSQLDGRAEYKAKRAGKTVFINRASLVDEEGVPSNFVERGGTIRIELVLTNDSQDHHDVALGVSIESQDLLRVLADFTLNTGEPFACHPGVNCYRLVIPEIPLNQGLYHVTLAVHDWKNTQILDRCDQCFAFEIIEPAGADGIRRRTGQNGVIVWPVFWEQILR